jgi:putative phosphoribosyl transferase
VIVVDDGVATGGTDAAALRAIRRQRPWRLVLAVPVCVPAVAEMLAEDADEVVTLLSPRFLDGVGLWFHDFSQVSDAEVIALLERGPGAATAPQSG